MASSPSPASLAVKWVVVPAALVVVGYLWLGPYLGHTKIAPHVMNLAPAPKAQPKEPETSITSAPAPHPAAPTSTGPSVTFAVRPANPSETAPHPARRRRRRRHKVHPAEAAAPQTASPTEPTPAPSGDTGGSGGATTAGATEGTTG